jgi:hypothetical protein
VNELVAWVQAWLVDAHPDADIGEVRETLRARSGELPAVNPETVSAYRPGAGEGWMFLGAMAPWQERWIGRSGPLLVIADTGRPQPCNWAAILDDPDFWIRPGGAFLGFDPPEVERLPFCFDGAAWEGTVGGQAGRGDDWVVPLDGRPTAFQLGDCALRYRESSPAALPGLWLEVTCRAQVPEGDGECVTVEVDGAGGLWVRRWARRHEYRGLAAAGLDPVSLLPRDLRGIDHLCSEVLTVRPMLDAVLWAARHDPAFDLSELTVSCVDFEGLALDLPGLGGLPG